MAEVIEEKGHAVKGPSGAKRRKLCPGSVAMEEGREDRPSRYAAEGTVAHTVMELCLSPIAGEPYAGAEPQSAYAYLGRVFEADGFEFEVTDEMAEAVDAFVTGVMAYVDVGDTLLVEQSVPIEHITGEAGATGTADIVILKLDGTLCVFDLKYGKGVAVYAVSIREDDLTGEEVRERNEQALEYAFGALEEHALTFDCQKIVIGIGQPRKHDDLDTDEIEAEEFAGELARLQEFEQVVDLATNDRAFMDEATWAEVYLRPSEGACKFCKAKAVCPALLGEVAEAVSSDACSPDDFADLEVENVADEIAILATVGATPAEIGGVLDAKMSKVGLIEEWCKAIRAEMDDHLLNRGGESTLFKVVEGKRGARKWIDEVEATAALKGSRLKVDEMFNQKLKTPTQIEKEIKDGKPRVWKKMQEHITQADGKPSVAPMSDKRAAIKIDATVEDFADLGDDEGSDLI